MFKCFVNQGIPRRANFHSRPRVVIWLNVGGQIDPRASEFTMQKAPNRLLLGALGTINLNVEFEWWSWVNVKSDAFLLLRLCAFSLRLVSRNALCVWSLTRFQLSESSSWSASMRLQCFHPRLLWPLTNEFTSDFVLKISSYTNDIWLYLSGSS